MGMTREEDAGLGWGAATRQQAKEGDGSGTGLLQTLHPSISASAAMQCNPDHTHLDRPIDPGHDSGSLLLASFFL